MHRYEIPIDDKPHVVALTDTPVAAATQRGGGESPWGHTNVEIWAEYSPSEHPITQFTYQIFGTGHPLPDNARHVLTCPRDGLGLVWHVYELV